MTLQERASTLFVGVDVHKDTHTVVGLSPFGERLFEKTIGNYEKNFESLLAEVDECAAAQGLTPCFGLEDAHGYGERLATFLTHARRSVMYVPPVLVDRERGRMTHPEKNDALDAQGVAKVMIQGIDRLPHVIVSEKMKRASVIKELSQDREYLVKEQTRLKNQLHGILHRIWNTAYQGKFKNPFGKKALRHWPRAVPKSVPSFLVSSLKRKVRRLSSIQEEVAEIEKELNELMERECYTLSTASGCGTVIAAVIIGEIGDIARFDSPAALAKYAGCAPREHSSGKTIRHRKTRGGNRRLNYALHRMALSQISGTGNEKAREYFQRKVSEGKSKVQALACLRRQMVNIVWMMLKTNTPYDACWKEKREERAALCDEHTAQEKSEERKKAVLTEQPKKRGAPMLCERRLILEMTHGSSRNVLQREDRVDKNTMMEFQCEMNMP